ncbi:MAG: hypothetical protein ABIE43_05635 [Patescibacteria group bacterium]
MEENLIKKIDEQGVKIDAIYKSVEKTRKYFLIIIWGSIICFVLPLIGLMFVIPTFIKSYLGSFEGLL